MLRRIDVRIPDDREEPLLGLAEVLGISCFSSPCLVPQTSGGEEDVVFSGETVVSLLFSTVEQDAPGIRRRLTTWLRRENLAKAPVTVIDYPDQQDWMEGFRQYFQPIRAGKGIVVCPPWAVPDEPAAVRILIDPGMAFGTGTHETTRLCLQLLEGLPQKGGRFLDLGAGSGILAFYLIKKGAAAVVAVEKEGPAVENLKKNAALNEIGAGLDVRCADLTGFSPPFPADGLVANLSSPLLLEHLSSFSHWVVPGGWGVFSGVNSTNVQRVREAFPATGWKPETEIFEGEWHGFLARSAGPRKPGK